MSGAERRYRLAMRLLWSPQLRQNHGKSAAKLFVELHRDAAHQGGLAVIALWARSLVGLITTRRIEWRRRRAAVGVSGGSDLVRGLMRDLVGGLRQLAQRPLVSAVVVTTLALGVGVNAATFAVFRAVELSGLPVKDPERLAVVRMDNPVRELVGWQWSYPNIRDLREASDQFESFAVYGGYAANLLGPDGPQRVSGARISTGFLSTLGLKPVLGREFVAEEDRVGGPKRRPHRLSVVGTAVRSQSRSAGRGADAGWRAPHRGGRVAAGSTLPGPTAVAGPNPECRRPRTSSCRSSRRPRHGAAGTSGYGVVGRLAPQATAASADAEARTLLDELQVEYASDFCCDWHGYATPLHDVVVGNTGRALSLAVLAAMAVLALVCVNLGSLLTVRAAERGREFAVRRSIGAGPGRLARQVLVEHVVLGVVGGGFGLGLGAVLLRALVALAPVNLPRVDEIVSGCTDGVPDARRGRRPRRSPSAWFLRWPQRDATPPRSSARGRSVSPGAALACSAAW